LQRRAETLVPKRNKKKKRRKVSTNTPPSTHARGTQGGGESRGMVFFSLLSFSSLSLPARPPSAPEVRARSHAESCSARSPPHDAQPHARAAPPLGSVCSDLLDLVQGVVVGGHARVVGLLEPDDDGVQDGAGLLLSEGGEGGEEGRGGSGDAEEARWVGLFFFSQREQARKLLVSSPGRRRRPCRCHCTSRTPGEGS
jgi:hypothetical protein